MPNKLVLLGVRNLVIEEDLKPQRDYGISLIAQRISEELEDTDSDEEPTKKYRLKVVNIDKVFDLQESKEIKFRKSNSPSQKQKFRLDSLIGEDEYEPFMSWLLPQLDDLADKYRDR